LPAQVAHRQFRCSAQGAQGLVDSLTFELKVFGGQASQHDDITCMAVRMV
jgi:serine phosphatase RsbU (regulator of sigma subunit)